MSNNTENNTTKILTFCENDQKLTSEKLPKCELISGKIKLGRPGWPIFILSCKSAPHVLQKSSQRTKNCVKRGPEFSQKWWPRPGGLREALTIKPASWTLSNFGGCPKCLKWSSRSRPMTDFVRKNRPQMSDQPSLFLSLLLGGPTCLVGRLAWLAGESLPHSTL